MPIFIFFVYMIFEEWCVCVDLHDFCQHHTDCQVAGFWTKGSAPLMSTDTTPPLLVLKTQILYSQTTKQHLGYLNWTTYIDTIFMNNILSLWRKKEAILKQITEAKYVLWSAFPAFWKEQGISEAWRRNVSSLEISWDYLLTQLTLKCNAKLCEGLQWKSKTCCCVVTI